MAASPDIAKSIESLSSRDGAERERAAGEIFSLGRTNGASAIKGWKEDPEAGPLFIRNDAGDLKATIGLAVFPESFEKIHAANGLPRMADVPPDQDAREFELHFPGGVALDILTTRDPSGSGAIAKYLAKFGEGIQQVEFLVAGIDRITAILRQKLSSTPIYPTTRPGADGTRVNFFLMSASGGGKILIELVEALR